MGRLKNIDETNIDVLLMSSRRLQTTMYWVFTALKTFYALKTSFEYETSKRRPTSPCQLGRLNKKTVARGISKSLGRLKVIYCSYSP